MSDATRCHAGSAVDRAPRGRNAVAMRQLVMQMMTTLNGRLDHPEEWVPEIPGDLYAEIARSMARKMNTYKKYVFTRASEPLEWSNVELVRADGDQAVVAFVEELKAR